jgi:FlaA1/EpsC-like NDP-sugar epimerase
MPHRGFQAASALWRAVRMRRLLHRAATYAVFALYDGFVVFAAYAVAVWLRFNGWVPERFADSFQAVILQVIVLHLLVNQLFRMYWRGWRYAGVLDAMLLAASVGVSTLVVLVVAGIIFADNRPLPRTVIPVAGTLVFLGMGVGRFRHRLSQQLLAAFSKAPQRRLLILGAGQVGQSLARELLASPTLGYRPVGFVDDDPRKLAQWIHGLRVLGTRHDLKRLVKEHGVQAIAFALPSLTGSHRQELLSLCLDTGTQLKIVPGLSDLLRRQPTSDLLRDARIEDLLGRPRVAFAPRRPSGDETRTVLVTGAAGSIGSELASQIAMAPQHRLILLDVDESRLFDLAAELDAVRGRRGGVEVVVGDVTRVPYLERLFAEYRPDAVYHTAAYKHVPLMEKHPAEAIRTNVLGTYHLCAAAERAGCERVVFISTDKAVMPSNVMGATKRVGERIIEAFSTTTGATYCAVRFGNVLGSRGSLIPTVTRQIRLGGPVTITHPEMTRFFMTIPEAASLILEAAHQARSGDIFILDMGEPISVADLVYKLVRLHGLEPGEDIAIEWIGPRPGEKLHEALVYNSEALCATDHPAVRRVLPATGALTPRAEMKRAVDELRDLLERGPTEALVASLYRAAGVAPPLADGPLSLPAPVREPPVGELRVLGARAASPLAPETTLQPGS